LVGESLVFVLTIESEIVLGLAIWDLVGSEPFSGVGEVAWLKVFNVFEVVDLVSELVFDVDADDLPVGLSFVDHGEDTESFDLDDFTSSRNSGTDFADINGVVVTTFVSVLVNVLGVLPGLGDATVVPWVSSLGVNIGDVSEVALLDVLLDGVHFFLGCDFHLGIGPAGHFNNHVVDLVLGISERGNVVEGTDDLSIGVLVEDSEFKGVLGSSEDGRIRHFGFL